MPILEATCQKCGETFMPNDEDDLEHGLTEMEEPCGGQGILEGGWFRTAAEAKAYWIPENV